MWNRLDLPCPTSDIVEYAPEDCNQTGNLQDFVAELTKAADILTDENPIWKETSVFQNIQAKYKRILRCDKCLIFLHRFFNPKAESWSFDFGSCYCCFCNCSSESLSSKRKQCPRNLSFSRHRSMSETLSLPKVLKYSPKIHQLTGAKLHNSNYRFSNVMLSGILLQLCDTYQRILAWCSKLKEGTHVWEQKVDLPVNLEKWLSSETKFINDGTFCLERDDYSLDGVDEQLTDASRCGFTPADTDFGEVLPREKETPGSSLSREKLLKSLLSVENFSQLQVIWKDIAAAKHKDLPKALSLKNKKVIRKFLALVQKKIERCSAERFQVHVQTASKMIAKYLGLTQANSCGVRQQDAAELRPAKTLKGLKRLHKQLYQGLKSANNVTKCRKLKKIFKECKSDIKLLIRNGEQAAAKKLIVCTSKVILTLCNA